MGKVPQEAIVIAGPNGAGKTTFAREYLKVLFPNVQFLNVDEIQREDSAFAHPVAAGKQFLARLRRCEEASVSFAIETTLASRMYAKRIVGWKAKGYRTTLHFIELPSVEFALQRVAMRVAAGGHNVPDVDVRRRFLRGLELVTSVYQPLVDQWYHWQSDDRGLRLVNRNENHVRR